uniref:Uncharacterized protein n=1 Tax=Ptisana novoguineensis TaxID=2764333 RepID=A0A7G7YI34_9MONI|nr:hypothetical protein I9999_pgp088 [Ptisana novoguineensis]QNH94154.1 hypothetical protein [Ptisana novoguineensis]
MNSAYVVLQMCLYYPFFFLLLYIHGVFLVPIKNIISSNKHLLSFFSFIRKIDSRSFIR